MPDRPAWSTEVARARFGGVSFLAYPARERSLLGFLDIAARWGDRTHLIQGERRLGLLGLRVASGRGAGTVRALGVRPGDRVLLLGWNSIDWVIAFWSILRAGGVVVTGNRWWSEEEVTHAVGLVAPALVLADHEGPEHGDPRWAGLNTLGVGDPAVPQRPPADEEADAVIMFTSGSTGLPKAAVFSHRAMVAGLHSQLQITRRLPQQIGDDHPRQATLQTTPLFHVGGVQAVLRAALLGATLVLTDGRFDPPAVMALIEREGVERWSAVPTMVTRVLDDPSLCTHDLSGLRSLTLGGAPVSPELMSRVRAAFPSLRERVGTGWGLTEAGGQLTAASGSETLAHPGSVGRALAFVELRVAGAAADEQGEILARSPMQMSGYLDDTEATQIDGEGWLHTGDVGRIDEDRRLWLTGRSKDVIVRGGENVAAPRVEQVLLTHEAVAEVAVLGLPDPDVGEEVAAAVVIRREVTADELRRHAAAQLARFAVPTRWWLRTEPLPVNRMGKVVKPELRDAWPSRG